LVLSQDGADADLKLGAQKRLKIFLKLPPILCSALANEGHCGGTTSQ